MKIPYPGDLNPIETAVWAAEYIRVRAERLGAAYQAGIYGRTRGDDIEASVEEANRAVDDLRHAQEHA